MLSMSRRRVLAGSVGGVAAGALARPYIAKAQAKTAVFWAGQGFIPEEDIAMRKVCEDYMKESGNKLDYSIMPFMALNQKTISALTSGDVPDLVFMDAPETILPQNAWDDNIVDVSDVVAPYVSQLSETAKLCSTFYNKATKKRAYYLCPIKQGTTSSIPSFLSHDSNAVDVECRPVAVRRLRSGQVDWIAPGSDVARDEQQGASQRVTASQAAVIWRSK